MCADGPSSTSGLTSDYRAPVAVRSRPGPLPALAALVDVLPKTCFKSHLRVRFGVGIGEVQGVPVLPPAVVVSNTVAVFLHVDRLAAAIHLAWPPLRVRDDAAHSLTAGAGASRKESSGRPRATAILPRVVSLTPTVSAAWIVRKETSASRESLSWLHPFALRSLRMRWGVFMSSDCRGFPSKLQEMNPGCSGFVSKTQERNYRKWKCPVPSLVAFSHSLYETC